jgi:hypothetical protein
VAATAVIIVFLHSLRMVWRSYRMMSEEYAGFQRSEGARTEHGNITSKGKMYAPSKESLPSPHGYIQSKSA